MTPSKARPWSSGSGNVAIFATEKAQALGAKVVTASDSNGYIYDPNGIQLTWSDIKLGHRGRIRICERVPGPSTTRAARACGRSVRHRPAVRHPERDR
ncbi:MAG: hypothetical protein ACLSUZ_02170 [Bifidobacterium pseudocatenulatum]